MPCVGRYASAEDFVGFFCVESRLSRVHTGANGAAVLTDSMAHFVNKGVLAGEGMIVYNVTDGSQGAVTAVTDVTITATLAGGTGNVWDTGDVYLIVTVDAFERATIEHYLDVTASDLHAALAAQGMCNCTLSAWGLEFLKKLNIIDAASFYSCGCAGPRLTDEVRRQYREWMTVQLDNIRTGKLDLCDNVTGAEFPAFGSIKENVTDFAAAQIIADRLAKGIP
jgi:hypothetical protein